jgi:hypothetical protein
VGEEVCGKDGEWRRSWESEAYRRGERSMAEVEM